MLDRTKEPGAHRRAALSGCGHRADRRLRRQAPIATFPKVIGGRYGLSSKEFTPAMVKARLRRTDQAGSARTTSPSASTTTSPTPAWTTIPTFSTEDPETVRAMFYGLGSDGTVGANKNSIKIIGEDTDNYAQGYFVYDSKKSGAVTISHLRFGPKPIRSHLSDHAGQLRRLPPVQLPGAVRRAEVRRARRDLPAEQPVRPGRGLGPPAALGAGGRSSTRS